MNRNNEKSELIEKAIQCQNDLSDTVLFNNIEKQEKSRQTQAFLYCIQCMLKTHLEMLDNTEVSKEDMKAFINELVDYIEYKKKEL